MPLDNKIRGISCTWHTTLKPDTSNVISTAQGNAQPVYCRCGNNASKSLNPLPLAAFNSTPPNAVLCPLPTVPPPHLLGETLRENLHRTSVC